MMGSAYSSNSDTGYNASPPDDDGSTSDSNKIKWSNHKSKLTDPIRTNVSNINSDIVDYTDWDTITKTGAYTTLADDNNRVIETSSSPTITLGAPATMKTGFTVTVKTVSGTTTVSTGGNDVDGSSSNRSLAAGEAETYRVNAAAGDWLLVENKGMTAAETATLTNKTFDANGTGNSLSNVDVADLANGTDGELITWDSAGAPTAVPTGTSGQVLTSNGAGAEPTFQNGKSTETVAASSSTCESTAVPSGTTRIELALDAINPSLTSRNLILELGSGSYSGAGEAGCTTNIVSATPETSDWSSGQAEVGEQPLGEFVGLIILVKHNDNAWSITGTISTDDDNVSIMAGNLAISGAIDRWKFTIESGTIAGNVHARYYI